MPRKAWAGNPGRARTRTTGWRRLRPLVLARDSHTCRLCGQPGNQVDHIRPHAEGGPDSLANAQTLCDPCHKAKTEREKQAGLARLRDLAKRKPESHPGLNT